MSKKKQKKAANQGNYTDTVATLEPPMEVEETVPDKLAEAATSEPLAGQEAQQSLDAEAEITKKMPVKAEKSTFLRLIWRIISIQKEEIQDDTVSFSFISQLMSVFTSIVMVCLYLAAAVCMIRFGWDIADLMVDLATIKRIFAPFLYLLLACFAFIAARLLRIAKVEVGKTTSRTYIVVLLAALVGIVIMLRDLAFMLAA